MNSFEKYGEMLSLEPYADRSEIPVFPHMITTEAPIAGYTQAEVYDSPDKWLTRSTRPSKLSARST